MPGYKTNVVLFTDSFPFRLFTEEVFVMPEVEALANQFDRVIIVPHRIGGTPLSLPWENVTVDTAMAKSFSTRFRPARLPWLLHPWVLTRLPRLFTETKSPAKLISASFYLMNTRRSAHQINSILDRYSLNPHTTLLYSFWFDNVTDSFTLFSKYKAVTRAHGSDIFDSQIRHRVHFLREQSLSNLLGVFSASENGAGYLAAAYPGYASRIAVRRLGSAAPQTIAPEPDSSGNSLTLLSCSRVVAVKRVDRCLKAAAAIAEAFPFTTVHWIHIGDGPLMPQLRALANDKDNLPANLKIELPGAMPNEEVHRLYSTVPVNWFMLLSESEGLPVAVTEAVSYGVPVIATDVGGNSEIITPETGILVPEKSDPEYIVSEIQPYMIDPSAYIQLRASTRGVWEDRFNSTELRKTFATELFNLIS